MIMVACSRIQPCMHVSIRGLPAPSLLSPCPFGQSIIQSLGAISTGANAREIITGTEEQRNPTAKNRCLIRVLLPENLRPPRRPLPALFACAPTRPRRHRLVDRARAARAPAMHAPAARSPGQDRETRELPLLPSLRAARTAAFNPALLLPPRPRHGTGAREFKVAAPSRARRRAAGSKSNPPNMRAIRTGAGPGRSPRPASCPATSPVLARPASGGSRSIIRAAARLPLPPPLSLRNLPSLAAARVVAKRVASLSPRGV
jgi:hypothetical protein